MSPVFSCFTYNISTFYDFYQEQICVTESSDITDIDNFCISKRHYVSSFAQLWNVVS